MVGEEVVERVRVTVTIEVGVAIERQLHAVETALQAKPSSTLGQPGQFVEADVRLEVAEADPAVNEALAAVLEVVDPFKVPEEVEEPPNLPKANPRLSTAEGMQVVIIVPL